MNLFKIVYFGIPFWLPTKSYLITHSGSDVTENLELALPVKDGAQKYFTLPLPEPVNKQIVLKKESLTRWRICAVIHAQRRRYGVTRYSTVSTEEPKEKRHK